MPVYKADGIVLHRRNLGETDKILTFFCRDHGKLSIVAKGARRNASKLSGATELFTHSRILLAEGKSLDIVSQCEITECFPQLRTDLGRLSRATYFCELIDRLMEDREPDSQVFDLLLSALHLLQREDIMLDVLVHAFELRLLAHRGYAPVLDQCVKCGQNLVGDKFAFSPSLGGVLCKAHRYAHEDAFAIQTKTVDTLQQLMHNDVVALADNTPKTDCMAEINRCMRWYIRYRIDRDLLSAEFLELIRAT